jgi:hypothetical protein
MLKGLNVDCSWKEVVPGILEIQADNGADVSWEMGVTREK